MTKIPSRSETIREFTAAGGDIAAVLPIHYPRALFRAFNLLPVEVWGPPKADRSQGSAHIQNYVCSIVHQSLSFIKQGGLDTVKCICVPHTCDSLQGLGSLLIDFVPESQAILTIYLPRAQRQSDHEFLANEFRKLSGKLSDLTGIPLDESQLMQQILQEESANKILDELYQNKYRLELNDSEFYTLIRSQEFLPAEKFSSIAKEILAKPGRHKSAKYPLILSGIVPEPMALFQILNDLDAEIVEDDFACCGRRRYKHGVSEDPFTRMAESILSSPADSTRGHSIKERADILIKKVKDTKAKGVLFYDINFCEPELFDLPILKKTLKEEGIPSLALLTDISDPVNHQMQTRMEAFLELLD